MNHTTDRAPRERGVALVTVMAVMTVMALLAVMFIVLVEIERMSSNQTLAGLQARLIAASAREHALAILAHASGDTPGCTYPGQAWRTAFAKAAYKETNGTNPPGDFNAYGIYRERQQHFVPRLRLHAHL